jgi:lysophospholipid acyltransferase
MYYSPWLLSDAAMISCGLAYAGNKDGKISWDRIINIRIIDLEINSSSCIQMMAHWNHTVHLWLKRQVPERLLSPGQKPSLRETMIVFTVSAVWHGLYPFYYVMFFYCALIVELSKEVFRSRYLFSFLPGPVAHILANQLTLIALNYMGTSFNMLPFEKGYNFASATNFFVFILVFVILFIWKALGISKMAAKA